MRMKTYKPVTPGVRHLVSVDRSVLHKGSPCKHLTKGLSRVGGRNNRGVVTVRGIGGGAKRKYRQLDFLLPERFSGVAKVLRLEYDPNRTAFIALLSLGDTGELCYVLASSKMTVGLEISIGSGSDVKDGNILPLSEIPVGFSVYSVSTKIGGKAQLARSAGAYVNVSSKEGDEVKLRMRSGAYCTVSNRCYACVGVASNLDHRNIVLGKAGRSRWMGCKPKVRGVAMNPVDHPHGGGEGKSGTGGPPVTPWGKVTKGGKTSRRRKSSR